MRAAPFAVVLVVGACSAPRPIPRAALGEATPLLSSPEGRPLMSPEEAQGRPAFSLGAEVRAYPAGVIPALYGEHALSDHGALTFDLGANLTDRGDYGKHDQEDGGGFGGGLGYRYYFGERLDRWFVGGRVDLWSLSIDWEDDPGTAMQTSGSSDVLVLQPTVEGGYAFRLGERWRLNLFAAVGAEINVKTDGQDVGEGAIGILGVSVLYEF